MHIALFAGEPSGDQLGAELIKSLKKINSDILFDGVGGPLMQAEGFKSIFPMDEFAVMGLTEILRKLPKLFKYKHQLVSNYSENKPDVFLGIDYPEFNLRLEKALKEKGIFTAHYVSPSVWAWREKRIHSIKESNDLVLTLFPFEKKFYDKYNHRAIHCGHPLVDIINHNDLDKQQKFARKKIGIEDKGNNILAILPGSRRTEIERILPSFIISANYLQQSLVDLHCLIPVASNHLIELVKKLLKAGSVNFSYQIIPPEEEKNNGKIAMLASNAVLLASGTATLEAMLLNKPMVVAYKVSAITALIAKKLLVAKYYSLPNILADRAIVSEYIQNQVDPHNISDELFTLMTNISKRQAMLVNLRAAADQLKPDGAETAANALYENIMSRK